MCGFFLILFCQPPPPPPQTHMHPHGVYGLAWHSERGKEFCCSPLITRDIEALRQISALPGHLVPRKICTPNLNLWSCWPFFEEFDGESLQPNSEQEHGQTDGRKWTKKKDSGDKDAAGITSLVPGVKIRGFGLVLNSTWRNRFFTACRLRTDSGWSRTFRISRVILHEGEVAPLASQTLAHAIFSLSVCPSPHSNFDLMPSPSNSTE